MPEAGSYTTSLLPNYREALTVAVMTSTHRGIPLGGDRRYPPHVLKIAEEDNSALFIDVDGSVYRKFYDTIYGGSTGRKAVMWPVSQVWLRRARNLIADAWDEYDRAWHGTVRDADTSATTANTSVTGTTGHTKPSTAREDARKHGTPLWGISRDKQHDTAHTHER